MTALYNKDNTYYQLSDDSYDNKKIIWTYRSVWGLWELLLCFYEAYHKWMYDYAIIIKNFKIHELYMIELKDDI